MLIAMNRAWNPSEIARTAAKALAAREAELLGEHAVYGLDALDEVGLHPILASGFEGAGLGVCRERAYPGVVVKRARLPERERCDLVLLEDPGAPLLDPVVELKAIDASVGTLFEPVAEAMVPGGVVTEVGEAYWLEVKMVAQFAYAAGVPGPNGAYATQLVRGPAGDVVKIAREPMIESGGVMVALFCADEPTARHDLTAMAHKLLDQDLPIGEPAIEVTAIENRVGNGVCAVALVPVRL